MSSESIFYHFVCHKITSALWVRHAIFSRSKFPTQLNWTFFKQNCLSEQFAFICCDLKGYLYIIFFSKRWVFCLLQKAKTRCSNHRGRKQTIPSESTFVGLQILSDWRLSIFSLSWWKLAIKESRSKFDIHFWQKVQLWRACTIPISTLQRRGLFRSIALANTRILSYT